MSAGAESERHYAAFVSYRHVELDRSWAKWLHQSLETFRTPRELVAQGHPKRLGVVFRDEEELAASSDLSAKIDEALEKSAALIVVCSPDTPSSEWVNQEVVRFRELNRDDRILSLLVKGEPHDSFPRSLQEIRKPVTTPAGISRQELHRIEPLAADVRPLAGESPRHRRRMAKLRIIAGLLKCDFDELRQREQERKFRRLAALTSIMSVVLLLIIGLAWTAWMQWGRANDNLRRVEETLADSLLLPMSPETGNRSSNQEISGPTIEALWSLAGLPLERERVRFLFFERGLERLESASQIRANCPLVVDAAVGLNCDLRTSIIDELVMTHLERLQGETQREPLEVRLACVAVGNRLEAFATDRGSEYSMLACEALIDGAAILAAANPGETPLPSFELATQGLRGVEASQLASP